MTEISEVLYQWQQGKTKNGIAFSLGLARNTVKKIIKTAEHAGLNRASPLAALEAYLARGNQQPRVIKPGSQMDRLRPYHTQIEAWLVLPHMTLRQVQRLLKEAGKAVSYTTLRYYCQQQVAKPGKPKATVHLQTIPGQQAQVDFAQMGRLYDPITQRQRLSYAFIMTLSHSRHRFVRFVFRQDVLTWIDCHIRAFEFFQGVPHTVLLDNLKAGVASPDIYDPTLNRSYAELARYYGFVADPAKVRKPAHKGKVERSVIMVRQQLLAGRQYASIDQANAYALQWCRDDIAHVVTTTTGEKPIDRFLRDDRPALRPLPTQPFDCPTWQSAHVHFDHHVVFAGSFYSVPTAYLGQTVWIKATLRLVQVYLHYQLIKTHVRAQRKGEWHTDIDDYPEAARTFLTWNHETCCASAYRIGPFTGALIRRLLVPPTLTQLRKCQAILRLKHTYPAAELENLCQQLVKESTVSYREVRQRLDANMRLLTQPIPVVLSEHSGYLRAPHEFSLAEVAYAD